jgi:hypothetical protein
MIFPKLLDARLSNVEECDCRGQSFNKIYGHKLELGRKFELGREHAKGHLSFFAYDLVKSASIPFNFKLNSGMCGITYYSDVYTIILGKENLEGMMNDVSPSSPRTPLRFPEI